MKRNDLISIVDSIIPGLYSFSYALIPDELQAEQLIVDAFSVFLIREEEDIKALEMESARERAASKRYAQTSLLIDIFDLAKKRAPQLASLLRNVREHKSFYELDILHRAVLSAKENLKLSNAQIGEIFALKNHQVLEALHNSRSILLSGPAAMEARH